jgi:2-polyprenyl-3-methyl-5-hydroxy-6-metoxy-1,4-benzoquinol methylase
MRDPEMATSIHYEGNSVQNRTACSRAYQELVRALLSRKSRAILDIGCGCGEVVNCLLSDGFDAYGIDRAAEAVEIANRENPDRFFVFDATGRADQLPTELRGKHFGTVLSFQVINMSTTRKRLRHSATLSCNETVEASSC